MKDIDENANAPCDALPPRQFLVLLLIVPSFICLYYRFYLE